MNIVRCQRFGPVTAWEFGFAPVGRPVMTVYCYRIGSLLVDTAQRHMRRAVMDVVHPETLSAIALTHHHEDHSGNAAAIAATGAVPVFAHAYAVEKLGAGYRIRPYQHIIWGKAAPLTVSPLPPVLEDGRFRLTPIHTPGHSRDHTVFFDAGNGWLFSGDLFLGERIKFFRADEKLLEQIRSIRGILDLNFDALFCAHHPMPIGGKAALRRKLQFLEDCYGEVEKLVRRGMGESDIICRLDPGLDRLARWITLGNVSYANLLRSAYGSIMENDDALSPASS
ncbi:MAG: MBL fold metallo-hydrolase [Pseudomonadota bacterium]